MAVYISFKRCQEKREPSRKRAYWGWDNPLGTYQETSTLVMYRMIQCDGVIGNAVSAPRLSAWLEDNLYEGLTVFDFPLEHQRTNWTTNSLERINKEIRRRTRVVGVFPNEVLCLRLISALLMEMSEEWQIGKRCCVEKK